MHSKWDERYLALARHWADLCSKDPSTKVGAVIVNEHNRIVSLGYNGFPSGVSDDECRLHDGDLKHKFVQHAERNALDNADVSVRGCTLYSTLKPCVECSKSIAQKGISRVVFPTSTREDVFGWAFTDIILNEAGIKITEMF